MAEKTAKDHLDEDPKYYDKLEKIEEGILSWLGLERPSAPEREREQYTDYSQPESSLPLYIGAFPSIVRGEMEDALTRLKFKKIYNMSKDAKDLMKMHSGKEYNKLVNEDNIIVDEYAIEDLDLDETTDAQRIQEENAQLMTAAEQIKNLVKAGEKVLVVCSEGRNRSVATSIVALKALGMDAQQAYQAIKAARAKTMDEVELIKAAKENRRPRKINKPVMQIGSSPHSRFMRFAGIAPEKIEEMIERLLAKILMGG
jgi:protein-tyrosine phosphatase